MLNELSEAIDALKEDANVRCVIITGEGKKAFSTGADLTELWKNTPETAVEFSMKGQQVFTKLETVSKPVVAAINGYALGGGLELALACDFRLASSNAQFGCLEIKLGIIPAWGGTQRLPLIVGLAEAKRLIMLGDKVNAEEAENMGLVDKVVVHKELEAKAEALGQKLCEISPEALKYVKLAVNSEIQPYIDSGLKKERELFALLFSAKETRKKIEDFWSQRNNNRETAKSE